MPKRSEEQKLMRKWWMLLVFAAIFLGLSYGFVYLATDTGSLWQYAISIIFFVWGIKYLSRSVRFVFAR